MSANLKPKHAGIILPENQTVRAFAQGMNLACHQSGNRPPDKICVQRPELATPIKIATIGLTDFVLLGSVLMLLR